MSDQSHGSVADKGEDGKSLTPEADDGTENNTMVAVPVDQYHALHRATLLSELKTELDSWARSRVGVALVVITVLGFFGVQLIGYYVIEVTLGDKIDEAHVASALMKEATERTKEDAKTALDRANSSLETAEVQTTEVSKKLAELQGQAAALDKRFDDIRADTESESQAVRFEAKLALKGVEERLDSLTDQIASQAKLTELVGTLAGKTEQLGEAIETIRVSLRENTNSVREESKQELERLQTRLATINSELQGLRRSGTNTAEKVKAEQQKIVKKTEQKQIEFTQNSGYGIQVNYMTARKSEAEEIVSILRKDGYKVSSFPHTDKANASFLKNKIFDYKVDVTLLVNLENNQNKAKDIVALLSETLTNLTVDTKVIEKDNLVTKAGPGKAVSGKLTEFSVYLGSSSPSR